MAYDHDHDQDNNLNFEVVGFDGTFNEGAMWNYGPAVLRKGNIYYNAVMGWEVAEGPWKSAVNHLCCAECPESFDLGRLSLDEVTGNKSPWILAYHFDSDLMHILVDKTLNEMCEVIHADREFSAQKHKGARWLVFRNKFQFGKFRREIASQALDYLQGVRDGEELSHWHNPMLMVSGMNLDNHAVSELKNLVGQELRKRIKIKIIHKSESK